MKFFIYTAFIYQIINTFGENKGRQADWWKLLVSVNIKREIYLLGWFIIFFFKLRKILNNVPTINVPDTEDNKRNRKKNESSDVALEFVTADCFSNCTDKIWIVHSKFQIETDWELKWISALKQMNFISKKVKSLGIYMTKNNKRYLKTIVHNLERHFF